MRWTAVEPLGVPGPRQALLRWTCCWGPPSRRHALRGPPIRLAPGGRLASEARTDFLRLHGFLSSARFQPKVGANRTSSSMRLRATSAVTAPPQTKFSLINPEVPDGKLSDDTGHFQNPVSLALSDGTQRHATIVPARPRQTPPTSLTMRARWRLSTSPPPPPVRLRSFRAETFHGLTKPSRDSRTSRCLFCASRSSRSGSHRRRFRPDVSPTALGCSGPPQAETEARIMTHGASVAMLKSPWPGSISPSPSPSPSPRATPRPRPRTRLAPPTGHPGLANGGFGKHGSGLPERREWPCLRAITPESRPAVLRPCVLPPCPHRHGWQTAGSARLIGAT